MDLFTLLVPAVLLMIIWLYLRRPDPRLPPYPVRPLPIVGNLLSFKRDLRPLIKEWYNKCGDIFRIDMVGTHMIVLNGYDTLKEALVKNADIFAGRPYFHLDVTTGLPQKGIAFSEGPYWKEQRSATAAIFRNMGVGRNMFAEKITQEVVSLTKHLASLKGEPIDTRHMLNVSVSNIICSILFGNRFAYDDKTLQGLLRLLESVASDQQSASLMNFITWLDYLPGDLFKAKRIRECSQGLIKEIWRLSGVENKKILSENDITTFAEAYVFEMNKKKNDGVQTNMDNDSLKKVMLELFEGGSHTTSVTIYWSLLYLTINLEIQEKVYSEIKAKIGINRIPTILDKTELTYLNAVIMETQRVANIFPIGIPHKCREEITLGGYTLPKDSYIIINMDSVMYDEKIWGPEPQSFRPERFINENGKLKNPEEFIPFGMGRRICPGESLAKMELFLFMAFLLQRFKFLPADQSCPPTTEYHFGLVADPKHYLVKAIERQ